MTQFIDVTPIPVLKDNYIWMIINDHHQSIIVDPGLAAPVMKFLNQHHLEPIAIFITHHHWDHSNGIHDLKNVYDIPIFGPRENIPKITFLSDENDIIFLENFPSFRVMSIPGHTLHHIAYYSPGMLFCGDTLFSAGCGRLFEGTPEKMYASLQKIAALPDETKIYCAHEYTSTNLRFAQLVEPNNSVIAHRYEEITQLRQQSLPTLPSTLKIEKDTNPFLRCDSPEIIQNVSQHVGHELHQEIEVFTELRKWKDQF